MTWSLNYFYSSWKDNGQKVWYKHNVESGLNTWDWGWSCNTQFPIEFNFANNSEYKAWIVIAFAGWTDTGKIEYMDNHVYLNISTKTLPFYWANIWQEKYVQSSNSDFYVYHSVIAFYDHKILWNDKVIYTF